MKDLCRKWRLKQFDGLARLTPTALFYYSTDLCGEGRVMVIRLDGGRAIPLHTGFIGAAESYPATLILGMLYLAFVLRDQWPRRRYALYRVPF